MKKSVAIVIQHATYSLAGQAIAMRVTGDPDNANNGLFYLHSDHLGSASAMSNANGSQVGATTRYTPFGSYRAGGPNEITDRGFTGHRHNDGLGLIYMNARYYVKGIGRFASADTIVPDPTNPQSLNRYTYVLNSPVNLTDSTGHYIDQGAGGAGMPPCPDGPMGSSCGAMYLGAIGIASGAATTPEMGNLTANTAAMTPYLDTGDDVATLLTGCGYACQAGYEEPLGWGWRAVAGVGIIAPFGVRSVRTAVGLVDEAANGVRLLSARNWRNAEGVLGDFLGLPKNTDRYFVEGMSTYRIPDFIGDGFIADSKFYGASSFNRSRQLEDFATLAVSQDVPLYIYVREGTHISRPAQELVESTGGSIIRVFEGP